ncbi:winged helix-turn-helix domain-containing protein (plasmid) [Paenarthrobacter ureafaciens]
MKAQVSPLLDGRTTQSIIRILQHGSSYPKAIAEKLGLSQGYVSNRLAQLNAHGLVNTEKLGRHMIYSLSADGEQRIQAHEARMKQQTTVRGRPDEQAQQCRSLCSECGSVKTDA